MLDDGSRWRMMNEHGDIVAAVISIARPLSAEYAGHENMAHVDGNIDIAASGLCRRLLATYCFQGRRMLVMRSNDDVAWRRKHAASKHQSSMISASRK